MEWREQRLGCGTSGSRSMNVRGIRIFSAYTYKVNKIDCTQMYKTKLSVEKSHFANHCLSCKKVQFMMLFCQKILQAKVCMGEPVKQRKENLQDEDYALRPK